MASAEQNVSTSRKRAMMEELVRIVRRLPRSYYVVRGAIQWGVHDFDGAPLACAVHCDSATFLRDEGQNSATLSLEMLTQIPLHVSQQEGVSDAAVDDMTDDASSVFAALDAAEDGDGNAVITSLDYDSGETTEVADVARGIQGVVATARVTF